MKKFPKCFENFYIATTEPETILWEGKIKGSYHVVSFVKHFKYQIKEFMKYCDVDPFYIKIPEKTAHKCHVLRVSEKYWKKNGKIVKESPRYLEVFPQTAIKKGLESSYAHHLFFQKTWGLIDPFYAHKKFDKLKNVELHKYSTPKKVK